MRTHGVLSVAAAVVAGVVLAGCGGNDGGARVPTAGGGHTSAAAPKSGDPVAAYVDSQREWVGCMRKNGVDLPDPDAKGRVELGDQGRALKKDPRFLDASKKCAGLQGTVPEGFEEGNEAPLSPEQIAAAREFAACMQKNGAPDYPDPGPDGRVPDDNSGKAAWDQDSAGAKRAARICGPIAGEPTVLPSAKG
jgi:hypothetical protein